MKVKLPALQPNGVPVKTGTRYPKKLKGPSENREKRALGDAIGLKNFGVNLVRIKPGVESSIRHWHTKQDEFIFVLEGELILISDEGEQTLISGYAAGFKAGNANGHCIANHSDKDAVYLEIGDRTAGDEVTYPDVNLERRFLDGKDVFVQKDGTPY